MYFERLFRTKNSETLFTVIVDSTTRNVYIMRWDADDNRTSTVATLQYDAHTGDADAFAIGRESTISLAASTARALASDPLADPALVSADVELRARAEAAQDREVRGTRR